MRESTTAVAGLAVLRGKTQPGLEFADVMREALDALCGFPGFVHAVQFQSLGDPALFADLVEWSSAQAAAEAAEWAGGSSACQRYFEQTERDDLFGLLPVPRRVLALTAEGGSRVVQVVELASEPAGRPQGVAESALGRMPGCLAIEGGELVESEERTRRVLLAVWASREDGVAGAGALSGEKGVVLNELFLPLRTYPPADTNGTRESAFDGARADSLAERVSDAVNDAMGALNLYLGYRLGLFRALDSGAATSDELAARSGCQERYVREWLGCMAASEYVEHDPATRAFSLTPEQRAVLLEADHPSHALPNVAFIPALASALPRLMQAFRQGGGVPFEAYGPDLVEAQGAGYRPVFANELVSRWLPALPDIEARLSRGGRVADVGCGVGWSTVVLARAFPHARIDGVDPDARSIAAARHNAREAGVADRVTFHEGGVEDGSLRGPYELVTLFECLHDMAHPVKALRAVAGLLAPHGAVLVSDEKVGETIEENRTPLGRLYYNFSVLHCLPQAMVHAGSAATGAVMATSTVRRYAAAAGLSRVDVLPVDSPLFRFYRLGDPSREVGRDRATAPLGEQLG